MMPTEKTDEGKEMAKRVWAKTVAAKEDVKAVEIECSEWLAVGAEATRLIVEGMLSEARRWEAFASANHLSQKLDYQKGRVAALDELRQILKLLAPTANVPISHAVKDSRK